MAEQDVEVLYKQALSYMEQGDKQMAIEFFNKTIELDPNYSPAWNDKGIVHMELREFDEALKCFDSVMRVDPSNSMPVYNMGYVLLIQERYEDAVHAFDMFLERYPEEKNDFYRFALYLKAEAHYKLKQYDQAKELLDKAIKRDRLFKEARDLMIKILQEEKNIKPTA
jgi:tetratricopeptide (TPR) repeat protein